MLRKFLPLMGGALIIAIALGALALRPVLASSPARTVNFEYFGRGRGPVGDDYLTKALNITVEQLQTAYQKAYEAALNQAVKNGDITQKQADQLKANGTYGRGLPFLGAESDNQIDFDKLLADALGITVEKLQQAYLSASNARLDQAVTDGMITQEQADLMKARQALFSSQNFISSMQAAFEAAVKKAVSDGLITQAQADQILKEQSTRSFFGFGGRGGWGGKGGFGDFHKFGGRGHGMFPGMPGGNSTSPANPATTPTPGSGSL
jgi:ribosomal protein S20